MYIYIQPHGWRDEGNSSFDGWTTGLYDIVTYLCVKNDLSPRGTKYPTGFQSNDYV